MVSRRFVESVKLAPKRAYRIAWEAGVHPVTLSKLLNGIQIPKPNDARVLAVARVLGLRPEECFESGESAIATEGDVAPPDPRSSGARLRMTQ